ncbi:hypothetical protein [Microcoleus sp.]|uniref:hypothetical protein n=1 Tax=Microcoleus sp. TaxID=44472 RepID=UPI003525F567
MLPAYPPHSQRLKIALIALAVAIKATSIHPERRLYTKSCRSDSDRILLVKSINDYGN